MCFHLVPFCSIISRLHPEHVPTSPILHAPYSILLLHVMVGFVLSPRSGIAREWHEPLDEDLCPLPGSIFQAVGIEEYCGQYCGHTYIHWTSSQNTSRVVRYCGWIKYCWSPHNRFVETMPSLPQFGETYSVLESKYRRRKGSLMLLHSIRSGGLSLMWQVVVVGYCLPAPNQ